ncbi:DUF5666 domain-containing protein [Nocardia stercoris]|uniref:DUF5666 domain-containing protein n=1 Tax=Nocardia stercoris TaxID=2483361 RepID=A0A3M2KWU5_9NOCA|nr:DUF5666 domain-containing protein [Nocardia stercoris]RMI28723.1 hypothetical protein EBN03_29225 [Nocardia stercoris]
MTTPSGAGGENVSGDPWAQRPDEPVDGPRPEDATIPASGGVANAQPTEVIGGTAELPRQAEWGQQQWGPGEQWNAGPQWAPEQQWAPAQNPAGYPEPTAQYPTPGYPVDETARYTAGYPAEPGYPAEGYPPAAGYPGGPGYPTGQGYPPVGPGGPGMPMPGGPQPPKRRTGMWLAVSAAIFAAVVVGGALVGMFLGSHSSVSTNNAASPSTTSLFPPAHTPAYPTPSTGPNGPSEIPGLGNPDDGATMGTVQSNNAGTLTVQSLGGSSVTVHTDADTQILALGASTVTDLHSGDLIVVQGDKSADGSIQAKIIFGASLPTR